MAQIIRFPIEARFAHNPSTNWLAQIDFAEVPKTTVKSINQPENSRERSRREAQTLLRGTHRILGSRFRNSFE